MEEKGREAREERKKREEKEEREERGGEGEGDGGVAPKFPCSVLVPDTDLLVEWDQQSIS